jgi:hypothetical protein
MRRPGRDQPVSEQRDPVAPHVVHACSTTQRNERCAPSFGAEGQPVRRTT